MQYDVFIFAARMADSVPVSDVVCVDDMGKARVMEPVLADKVAGLRDQWVEFMSGNRGTDDHVVVARELEN